MMQKQLLVGSIFRDGGPDQAEWLDLQLRFLRATTPSFDHVSYVNSPTGICCRILTRLLSTRRWRTPVQLSL
jgi:hypothetical protein